MELKIYEVDYSVSPGGTNSFEILLNDSLVYETPLLHDAVEFAYSSGYNFTVYTLEAYHREFDEDNNLDTPAKSLTNVSGEWQNTV